MRTALNMKHLSSSNKTRPLFLSSQNLSMGENLTLSFHIRFFFFKLPVSAMSLII